jgi:hypothetical protein
MTPADAEEYTQARGQVVAGGWRQIALGQRLGVPQALGLTVKEWVNSRLGGYVKYSIAERRQVVIEAYAELNSERDAAAVLGISRDSVREDLGRGRKPTSERNDLPLQDRDAGRKPTSTSDLLDTITGLAADETLRAEVEGRLRQPHVAQNSGNSEWYTPHALIAAARRAMGSIDVDPASSEPANQIVQAETFYTIEQDGLAQPWHGNVWLNPPYSKKLIPQFAEAVSEKFDRHEITRACVLVNNATETEWFRRLVASAAATCFLKKRVPFWSPDRESSGPLQGQAVIYLGDDPVRFDLSFGDFGPVAYWHVHGH